MELAASPWGPMAASALKEHGRCCPAAVLGTNSGLNTLARPWQEAHRALAQAESRLGG